MSKHDILFLKSQNIWFGIPQADINFVKMNQKPGWFPQSEENYSGFYLIEDQVFKIIHLNVLFGEPYKPFIPAHMATLKKHRGDFAIACQELKTDISMPSANQNDYKDWLGENYQNLLTHWFPVNMEKLQEILESQD